MTAPRSSGPIGIYDSGLGGLSVVKHLQSRFPQQAFVYLADTARVPYGGRTQAEIARFSQEILQQLTELGAQAILCACNTSSVVILPQFETYQGVPVLGLAQAGVQVSRGYRRIAVLATEATVSSGRYAQGIQALAPATEVLEWACPEFAPLVESGRWGQQAQEIIAQRLAPVLAWQPDAVILGCSHYPYLIQALQAVLGPKLPLLDPASQLLKQLQQIMPELGNSAGTQHFYTTGNPEHFRPLAERYLQRELKHLAEIELLPLSESQPTQQQAVTAVLV